MQDHAIAEDRAIDTPEHRYFLRDNRSRNHRRLAHQQLHAMEVCLNVAVEMQGALAADCYALALDGEVAADYRLCFDWKSKGARSIWGGAGSLLLRVQCGGTISKGFGSGLRMNAMAVRSFARCPASWMIGRQSPTQPLVARRMMPYASIGVFIFVRFIAVIVFVFITFLREVKAPCADEDVPAEGKWGCIQERVALPAVLASAARHVALASKLLKQARRDAEKWLTNYLQQLHDDANHSVQTAHKRGSNAAPALGLWLEYRELRVLEHEAEAR